MRARVALATAAATLLIGGTAQAATVTIGSSLSATFTQTPFVAPTTVSNFILPAPANATSPTDGTVISWRFVGAGGQFTPRVLRSTAGTSHTGAGTGTGVLPTGAPPVISGPFTTSLPIKRGEFFGVNVPAAGTLGTATTAGATYLQWTPPLGDGVAGQAPTSSVAAEAAIGATVRFCKVPKLKGLPAKAARQALTAADCTIGNVTKSPTKRRPTKQVISQSVKANNSIADTAPVDFVVAPKKKPKRKKKKRR
jgi:PASTA domain-containing protein